MIFTVTTADVTIHRVHNLSMTVYCRCELVLHHNSRIHFPLEIMVEVVVGIPSSSLSRIERFIPLTATDTGTPETF